MSFGLKGKLFLPILIGGLALWAIVHFYWGPSLLSDKRKVLTHETHEILATLEAGVVRALLAGDLASIYGTLNQQMETHNSRWLQLVLINEDGQKIYPISEAKTYNGPYIINIDHHMVWSGRTKGKMSLIINIENDIELEQKRIIQLETFAVVVFCLIGVMGAFWQNIAVLVPVMRLKEAAVKVANGNYEHPLPTTSTNDEISALTDAFTTMEMALQKSQKELKTALAEAQASEIRQRTVLNNIADGIITLDETGAIESFSAVASSMFGYAETDVLGKELTVLLYKAKVGDKAGLVELISGRIELEGLNKNGTPFPLELSVTEMQIGGRRKFTAIARDITERNRVDKIKNEFVSTVSHELRTPLTSIHGALKLLNSGVVGELPAQMQEMLTIAGNNTERLLHLINDILDIQKIEAGKMEYFFEDVDLTKLLEESVINNRSYAKQRKVELVLGELAPAKVNVDPARLMQVMNNLISNAIKFSPENGVIELACFTYKEGVQIRVKDQGPGIPTEFHDKLFDQFTQSDSSDTRKVPGTGLGLSITKSIVERHGGEISFSTQAGHGTEFYVYLPICK